MKVFCKPVLFVIAAQFLSISVASGEGMSIYQGGRSDFGYGGSGGGNLEAYSKDATGNYSGASGQFKFIFGGRENLGKVTFTNYDGSTWEDKVVIMPNGNLIARGSIKATEMIVDNIDQIWPDYVFSDDYRLMPLPELKSFIEREGHLPGVPSADEINAKGHNLAEINLSTLEKIEEMVLYIIQLGEENDALRKEIIDMRRDILAIKR